MQGTTDDVIIANDWFFLNIIFFLYYCKQRLEPAIISVIQMHYCYFHCYYYYYYPHYYLMPNTNKRMYKQVYLFTFGLNIPNTDR